MASPDGAPASAEDRHEEGEAAIVIEVIHCPDRLTVDRETLRLRPGATLADALRMSGVAARHSGLDPLAAEAAGVGIHGRLVGPDTVLHDGDRIELYRPLRIDPKEARRARQRAQKAARPPRRGAAGR